MRVTIHDGRMMVGKFLAFDKHMNIVLAECDEYRRIAGKGDNDDREEKRALDLVVIRGECVVSMSVEGPPPIAENRSRIPAATGGVGRGVPAGRGMPTMTGVPPGLGGPVRGVGGPQPNLMRPGVGAQVQAGAMTYQQRPNMPPPGMPPPGMPPGMRPGGPPPGGRGGPPPMMGRGGPPPGMPPGMMPPGMGMPPGMRPPGMPPGMPPPRMPTGGPPPRP